MSDVIPKLNNMLDAELSMSEADAVSEAIEEIQSLRAPFQLTTEPPTEPGYYVCREFPDSVIQVLELFATGADGFLASDGQFVNDMTEAAWGSAPLPLVEEQE